MKSDNITELLPQDSSCAQENLSFKGNLIYSRYAPCKRAQQAADAFLPQSETLYLLPSPLLGYGTETVKKKCRKARLPFLFAECDETLFSQTKESDCFFFNPLKPEISLAELRVKLKKIIQKSGRIRKVSIFSLNEGYRLQKNHYDFLALTIQKEIDQFWKNRSTMIFFKDLWMRNFFRNISSPFRELSLRKESHPYFVCGAGESLEGALDFLLEKRPFLRLVAADTALPVLLKRRIVPDYVVVLESQSVNISDFLHGIPEETIYITELTSAPSVNRTFRKKKWIQTDFFDAELFHRLPISVNRFPQTGSVGIAALYAARQLTDGAVGAVGLDFCFEPGKSHSRGTDVHETLLNRTDRFQSVESTYRPPFKTAETACGHRTAVSEALVNYAAWIQNEAGNLKGIYDCRSDGLPLGLPRVSVFDFPLPEKPLPPLEAREACEFQSERFLQNEFRLLMTAEAETVADTVCAKTARQIDYLHYFFPDYSIEKVEVENYRTRLYFYIKKFKRLLEKLNRHPI